MRKKNGGFWDLREGGRELVFNEESLSIYKKKIARECATQLFNVFNTTGLCTEIA